MTEMWLDGKPLHATGFKVDITRHIEMAPTRWPLDLSAAVEVEATITVANQNQYKALLGSAPTFTLEATHDLNPNHRWAATFRQFARQLRDIMVWEYRNARYGPLAESLKVTLPNVRAGNSTIEGL